MDRFRLRPAAISSPCRTSVLEVALTEHLESPEALNGFLLEFGVAEAHTLNMIARHVKRVWGSSGEIGPTPLVFGFDSFRGLSRNWKLLDKGTFATDGSIVVSGVV